MFHHRIEKETPATVIFHWMLLSFLAGNVNAGGLLACGRFVSHVTGFYTLFGESAAHFSWDAALGILSIPFYFLIGVMISAYLVERPIHRGEKARYDQVMALVFICLVAAAALGRLGFFGAFGETHLKADYILLALLCLASGLQNAACSVASGHSVRTTHMTGNTTDLGIGVVRSWALKKGSPRYENELWGVYVRGGLIFSFAFGSAIGAMLFLRVNYLGFLLPAAIAFYTAITEALLGDHTFIFIPRLMHRKTKTDA